MIPHTPGPWTKCGSKVMHGPGGVLYLCECDIVEARLPRTNKFNLTPLAVSAIMRAPMRSKTKRINCPKCGAGPFPNAQALGAHNRHHHPKELKVDCELKEQARRETLDTVTKLALDRVQEENWYLRFLLRRGVKKIDPDQGAGLHAHVQQQILELERELKEALSLPDNSTPF